MLAVRPEVVVVVGDGGPPGVRFGAGDGGDLRGFGVDVELPFDGHVRPGGRRLPLAHTVGAWLLHEAGFSGTRVGVGPGRRGPAPARPARPPRRPRRRRRLRPALGQGARLPRRLGRPLRRRGRPRRSPPATPPRSPPWTRRGGAAARRRRAHLARGRDARSPAATSPPGCTYDDAPFGVGYLVADWVVAVSVLASRRGGRRPHRHGEDRPGRGAGAAAGRRGGQRRLDAALPRHGHRHREARPRRARRRAAPPARPVARARAGVRRGVPAARPGRDRPAARAPASSRCSWAARGSTSGPSSTSSTSRARTPRSGPGWRTSSPTSARPGCTRGWPALDPAAAATILPSNGRRIVRALEVIELTGGPFRASLPEPRPHYPAVVVGVDRDPAELDERIARAGRPDVGGRFRRRGRGPGRRRAARGADGVARARLRAGAGAARRRAVRRRRRGSARCSPPAASCAASGPGSAATRPLTWFDAARPDLLDAVTAEIAARTIAP